MHRRERCLLALECLATSGVREIVWIFGIVVHVLLVLGLLWLLVLLLVLVLLMVLAAPGLVASALKQVADDRLGLRVGGAQVHRERTSGRRIMLQMFGTQHHAPDVTSCS